MKISEITIRNHEHIQKSTECACIHCMQRFKPSEIHTWITEQNNKKTALCPRCGINAVLGDSSGLDLSEQALSAFHDECFKPKRGMSRARR